MDVDRIVTIAAAIASPVLGLLVDQQVISAVTATDIGGIVASAVASYHGGKAVQKRSTTPKHAQPEPAPAVTASPTP